MESGDKEEIVPGAGGGVKQRRCTVCNEPTKGHIGPYGSDCPLKEKRKRDQLEDTEERNRRNKRGLTEEERNAAANNQYGKIVTEVFRIINKHGGK